MKRRIMTVGSALFIVFALALPSSAEEKEEIKKAARKKMVQAEEESPLTITTAIGIGYDSNAYLAPSGSYDDPNAILNPINPVVHSGFFIPVELNAKYNGDPAARNRFAASFSFNADLYPQKETENAEEYYSKLQAGLEVVVNKRDRREDTFFIGPYISYNREVYFDRDEGTDKIFGTSNVSNRYNYAGIGLEIEFKQHTVDIPYRLRAEVENRNYEKPGGTTSELDQMYYELGGEVEIALAKHVKLEPSYTYSVRDYDERRALDQNANLVAGTTREYTYHELGASLRNALSKRLTVYLDYIYKIRNDEYVGYNDYNKNEYRIRMIARSDKGSRLRVAVSYWDKDYSNAFAFDTPGFPKKTYETVEAEVKGETALLNHWGLWVEYKYWNQNSTDLRYDYVRYQVIAGVKWEM